MGQVRPSQVLTKEKTRKRVFKSVLNNLILLFVRPLSGLMHTRTIQQKAGPKVLIIYSPLLVLYWSTIIFGPSHIYIHSRQICS